MPRRRGDAGLLAQPGRHAATLRGGWLHTGDVGAFDAEGYLTLKDRSKDMIISGGSNIYPREIEEVLLKHPGVREASVIGRPHPDWGEVVVAFVVGDGAGRPSSTSYASTDRALQAAEGLRLRRRAAEEQLRQDPEDRSSDEAIAAERTLAKRKDED